MWGFLCECVAWLCCCGTDCTPTISCSLWDCCVRTYNAISPKISQCWSSTKTRVDGCYQSISSVYAPHPAEEAAAAAGAELAGVAPVDSSSEAV